MRWSNKMREIALIRSHPGISDLPTSNVAHLLSVEEFVQMLQTETAQERLHGELTLSVRIAVSLERVMVRTKMLKEAK